ncbi:40796_t:CDS:2, partial [Gigaspora margarita]
MTSLKNWFNSAVSGEEFNEIQYDDLREFNFVDRGAFGEVFSANYVSNKNTVAVKKVFQSYLEKQDAFDAFIKELKLHIKLGDSNRIINFLGVNPNDGSYLIVMEYADSGKPDLRPNIDEIVVRLNTMRLEPVYCPPSQMPVNSRSLNALLSSISTGHNPTLIFDETLAVQLKSIDEIPPDYGTCKCGCKFTNVEWCKKCESEKFRRNFRTWTSGNQQLDELIKKSQLEATHVSHYIEWIGYDQLKNLGTGTFSKIRSAIWHDGPREEWDEETGQWERASNTEVAIKFLTAHGLDISMLLKEVKLHLSCDKVIQCYGVTFNPYNDNYGLVLKYASYGDLRSFINKRAFIGWWQKLKILEGVIQGLNQIHLRAGYIHRDLHSGNILIDQDELSVLVLVRGLKKRRRAKNIQRIIPKLLNFPELKSAKYTSIEYNFDKDNLLT